MENKTTELVFILDKSGSMSGLESDTIGGFNAMIEKQKALEGKVYVSTLLFSTHVETLHDRLPLKDVQPLTPQDYQVGGCTALLDAVGGAIEHIATIHKYARKEDVPHNTMFIITTDGMENASTKYSREQVKAFISEKEKLGWNFLFLAANIDAVETAESIGIRKERAVNYNVEEDTDVMFSVMSDSICEYRATGAICGDWAEKIEKRSKSRRKK